MDGAVTGTAARTHRASNSCSSAVASQNHRFPRIRLINSKEENLAASPGPSRPTLLFVLDRICSHSLCLHSSGPCNNNQIAFHRNHRIDGFHQRHDLALVRVGSNRSPKADHAIHHPDLNRGRAMRRVSGQQLLQSRFQVGIARCHRGSSGLGRRPVPPAVRRKVLGRQATFRRIPAATRSAIRPFVMSQPLNWFVSSMRSSVAGYRKNTIRAPLFA
jgi:hypothetical protein